MKKTLIVTALLALTTHSLLNAQAISGQWNEIVGKSIFNNDGEKLGTVVDSILDLENGRYLGLLVTSGDFLGFGGKKIIVPPTAIVNLGVGDRLNLDMSLEKFRSAPVYDLPKTVGPPDSEKVAEVFRYFGQTPLFAVKNDIKTKNYPPLGYLRKSNEIIFMEVESLEGVGLGYVDGLRGLNPATQTLEGILIQPSNLSEPRKIVTPDSLRYSLNRNRLRINDDEKNFAKSAKFFITQSGQFKQEQPTRVGKLPPPLVHGESSQDKAITLAIAKRISADSQLTVYGKNIEIATLNGVTTLRGRVANEANRERIVRHATEISGPDNVSAEIEIRPLS